MSRMLTHDGKTMSMKRWAAKMGIGYTTLSERLRTSGMSVAEALTTPVGLPGRRSFLTLNGRTQSAVAWSRETGLARTTISNRLCRGWTDEETLTTPPRPRKSGKKRTDAKRANGEKRHAAARGPNS